jgi:hypothetical protein
VYEYGQLLFGRGFLEEVDSIRFFDMLLCYPTFPFTLQLNPNKFCFTIQQFLSQKGRHLIRHYSPEAAEKPIVDRSSSSILHWLVDRQRSLNEYPFQDVPGLVALTEHCLATLSLEFLLPKVELFGSWKESM